MDRVIIYHLYKFPEAKTKSDQELEPYIQRIVRAIGACKYILLQDSLGRQQSGFSRLHYHQK